MTEYSIQGGAVRDGMLSFGLRHGVNLANLLCWWHRGRCLWRGGTFFWSLPGRAVSVCMYKAIGAERSPAEIVSCGNVDRRMSERPY